jgi:SpoIID/LytB domain protein
MMQEPLLNIAIIKGTEIEFELHGNFVCNEFKCTCNGKFKARLENNEIVITGEAGSKKSSEEVIFDPEDFDTESFLLKGVTIGIDFHWEQKENQRFLGSLKFLIEDNNVVAVNIIPIEHYITSVISSEMNANSSAELLKAHSIISRSWVLAQIEKGKELNNAEVKYKSKISVDDEFIKWYDREDHTHYDVCADDHCQRYQGITKLHAHNAQQSISLTRGLVLEYNSRICDTRFSKSCGGISELFENVWEPVAHEYMESISDYKFEHDEFNTDFSVERNAQKWVKGNPPSYCNTTDKRVLSQVLLEYDQKTTDYYRWKVEYTQQQIAELINSKLEMDFGEIVDLIPVERGPSARLIRLKIVGTKKTLTIGKELEIRRTLSRSHLYSSAFIIEKSDYEKDIPQKFTLLGAGWGHGVGLCQIGAAVMGDMGHSFDEILLHYFKGAKIRKLYE